MTKSQTKQIINLLTHKGVLFDEGLSDLETKEIEEMFDIKFPEDLKQFLQLGLPVNDRFINWRQGLKDKEVADKIIGMINWPLEGMLFDIEHNAFWVDSWGEKPVDFESQAEIAKRNYYTYPKLIPIYGHRFIPSEPNEAGNPVFSIVEMDIIYYGYDLATYFAHEFHFKLNSSFEIPDHNKREIRFWSSCVY